jgi:hypothetical protein
VSEHKQVAYFANCRACETIRTFTDYEERAQWVGTHRVRTGHTVGMWIGVDPA